jgi:hypothetical protein
MRRTFVLAALAALLANSAVAAEKAGAPGTNVDMPILMAPMTKDGMLLGYAYVTSVLVATSPKAAIIVRDRIAFIQDAFVRDVNATSIAQPADPTQVDRARLAARLTAVARRVVGADKVVRINFTGGRDAGIAFAPLHQNEALQPADVPAPRTRATAAAEPSSGGAPQAGP